MTLKKSLFTFVAYLFLTNLLPAQTITAIDNGDWSDITIWDLNRVPISSDTVIIDGFDVKADIDATVAKIQLSDSTAAYSGLNVYGGGIVLEVTGDINVIGTSSDVYLDFIVKSTDSVYVGGNLTITRNEDNNNIRRKRLRMEGDGKLTIKNDLVFNYLGSGGSEAQDDIHLYGNSILEVQGDAIFNMQGGNSFVFLANSSSKALFSGNVTANLNDGNTLVINVDGSSIATIAQDFNIINNNPTSTGSSVYFHLGNGSGSMSIAGDLNITSNFNNEISGILINGSSAVLDIRGDINFEGQDEGNVGAIIQSDASIFLGGNINRSSYNNYGDIDMEPGTSITYDGLGAQIISANDAVNNGVDSFQFEGVIIDNSIGPLSLEGVLIVEDNLNMTNGIIQTSVGKEIILADEATISGGNKSSYIEGPILKVGRSNNQPILFPLGENGIYAPIEIEKITDALLEVTVQYFGCPPPVGAMNAPLAHINQRGYWEVTRSDGGAVGDITLHWSDANDFGLTDMSSLAVSYYNGFGGWFSLGRGTTTGSVTTDAAGSIENDLGCPPPVGGNLFAIGSTDELENVLPIELIELKAFKDVDQSNIYLEWATATETNSSHFVVEKSADGINFESIGVIQAAGNSEFTSYYNHIDKNPFTGNNYYRLVLIDEDYRMSISDLVNVLIGEEKEDPVLYPNPVTNYVKIYHEILDGYEVWIKIFNLNGSCIYSGKHLSSDGNILLHFSEINLSKPGTYFLTYEDRTQVYSLQFSKISLD